MKSRTTPDASITKTEKGYLMKIPAGDSSAYRFAQIDDISSITGKDLIMDKKDQGAAISFSYDKKIPLAGPASILLEFRGSSSGK